MKCWMTRLRARCGCGCKFEAFTLPPGEDQNKWIARTRSGFAAFVTADALPFAEAGSWAPATVTGGARQTWMVRVAALVGDAAPDGQPYDTALGPVCPRCGLEALDLKVDKQVPEVVVGLPLVTYQRWQSLNLEERRAAVAAVWPAAADAAG